MIGRRVARAVTAPALYVASLIGAARNRELFDGVRTCCQFVGYPRSGHSLVGALLNAHPNMAIAHEAGALAYWYLGFGTRQVYWLILRNARRTGAGGRVLGGYVYDVPGQWQGRVRELRVIGDKEGLGTTLRIRRSDRYLERLRAGAEARIRFIHVVRNPYDIISTRARRDPRFAEDPELGIRDFFGLCETIAAFRARLPDEEMFELRHEDFVAAPAGRLAELCAFLGEAAPQDYLRDCASIVFESANRSRDVGYVEWSASRIDRVQQQIERFPFLDGYTFES